MGAIYRKNRLFVARALGGLVRSSRCPCLVLTPPRPPVRQEKRKKQAEIENKRRQLEDDRRQLQHLKVRGVRAAPPEPGLGRGVGGAAVPRDPESRSQMGVGRAGKLKGP